MPYRSISRASPSRPMPVYLTPRIAASVPSGSGLRFSGIVVTRARSPTRFAYPSRAEFLRPRDQPSRGSSRINCGPVMAGRDSAIVSGCDELRSWNRDGDSLRYDEPIIVERYRQCSLHLSWLVLGVQRDVVLLKKPLALAHVLKFIEMQSDQLLKLIARTIQGGGERRCAQFPTYADPAASFLVSEQAKAGLPRVW
jgi:hypothetical protein